MQLTTQFKQKVVKAILEARKNYSGADVKFAQSLGINNSVYSRLKKGETDKLLAESAWLNLARTYNVTTKSSNWNITRTKVYVEIESNINYCKKHSKSMILIDSCGIGKSLCSKHVISKLQDAFYVDCSQGKTRQQFIRLIARTIGIDSTGRYVDVKNNLKYALNNILIKPIIVLDDAGYLDYPSFLEIQELWNGTEDTTGWYMIGDESLQYKINKGIERKKIGYKAIFSRFLDDFIHITPVGIDNKKAFLRDLIGSVAMANLKDKSKVNNAIKKCMGKETTLRYLKNLIQVNQ